MRDNIIRAGESYEEERLCLAVKSSDRGSMEAGKTGILV
jgi:hypothetical protein